MRAVHELGCWQTKTNNEIREMKEVLKITSFVKG